MQQIDTNNNYKTIISTKFFEATPEPDPKLVMSAREWHSKFMAGCKLVKPMSDKEIVDIYLKLS